MFDARQPRPHRTHRSRYNQWTQTATNAPLRRTHNRDYLSRSDFLLNSMSLENMSFTIANTISIPRTMSRKILFKILYIRELHKSCVTKISPKSCRINVWCTLHVFMCSCPVSNLRPSVSPRILTTWWAIQELCIRSIFSRSPSPRCRLQSCQSRGNFCKENAEAMTVPRRCRFRECWNRRMIASLEASESIRFYFLS